MSAVRVTAPRPTLLVPRARLRRCVAARAVVAPTRCDSRQLGTARLPADTNVEAFASSMFQWCTSLTTQGSNLPFVLPQRVDRLPTGFSLAFLQRDAAGKLESVATITAVVEQVDDAPMCVISGSPAAILDTLVDVPVVMESMPSALRRAVATSRSPPAANF